MLYWLLFLAYIRATQGSTTGLLNNTTTSPGPTTPVQKVTVHYSITGSKAFHPDSTYNVSATIYHATGDVFVTLFLKRSDGQVLAQANATLTNAITQIISVRIPVNVPKDSYTLSAMGSGALTFSDSTDVTVKRKTPLILIQTDKAMYKPGQTVLFRVSVSKSDLTPFQGHLDIKISDPSGNKVVQWLNQQNETGVISLSLPLTDQTPLGYWSIDADAEGNSYSKKFEVAQYVLPPFAVNVLVPPYFLANINNEKLQTGLRITVISTYTSGRCVKRGKVRIVIQIQRYSEYDQTQYPQKVIDTELVNGKTDTILPFSEILRLVPTPDFYWEGYDPRYMLSYRTIAVTAEVTDETTGIVLSGHNTVPCYSQKYQLQFLSFSPSNFKPGLTYTAHLCLKQMDGSVPDLDDIKLSGGGFRNISILVTCNYQDMYRIYRWWLYEEFDYKEPVTREINVTVDNFGCAKLSMTIESKFVSVSFQAQFNDTVTKSIVYGYLSINKFKSIDNNSIQVSFDGKDGVIKPNQNATFTVTVTAKCDTAQYQILSKGCLVLSGVVSFLSNTSTFSLLINKELATKLYPSARVFVSTFTANGEYICDSIEIPVVEGFANEVTLSFDRNETTPSENVQLTVNAAKNSTVFIKAVDISTLLLKSDNNITPDMISSYLRNDGNVEIDSPYFWRPSYIDGTDSSDIIKKCGLFVMTDGRFYINSDQGDSYFPMMVMRKGAAPIAEAAPVLADESMGNDVQNDPSSKPSSSLRSNFPETWLWTDTLVGQDCSFTLNTPVPDTITSWVASAFAVSVTEGIGVATSTATVTVFKPFFVSLILPYSVIRGEEFALQVTIYNYMNDTQEVNVTLEQSIYFTIEGNWKKTVIVESYDALSCYFWIIPMALDQIPIHVSASSPLAQDALIQKLLVKPEGVRQQYSTSSLVQLSEQRTFFNKTFDVSLPPPGQLVPGSQHIQICIVGDILGPTIAGLGSLLQMPCGCGEQNMLNLAPDTYILNYMSATNKLDSTTESTALSYISAGYQRQLTYQRYDGSYSAFGNQDQSGSCWLTGFVMLVFHQARDYIPIGDDNIAQSMLWIMNNQEPSGAFAEPPNGRVIHTDMQGQSGCGLPMTAYVLNALLENKDNPQIDKRKLGDSIDQARSYLENNFYNATNDPYALSIIFYAFARCNSNKTNDVLNSLEKLAIIAGDTKYWNKPARDSRASINSGWQPPYVQDKAVDIETAAYALLAYSYLNDIDNCIPIVKWLIKQRNANGGFSSTQDTVVALNALTEFAKLLDSKTNSTNMRISVGTDTVHHDFQITRETDTLYQCYELPPCTENVTVLASGSGSAIVQLNVNYNVNQTDDNSDIDLNVDVRQTGDMINLTTSFRWTSLTQSGMVLLIVNKLTGYQFCNIDELKAWSNVQLLENDEEKIVLYFYGLTKLLNVVFCLKRVLIVSNVKPASIKINPYYNPSSVRIEFYKPLEDLVQNSSCSTCPLCCTDGNTTAKARQVTTPELPVKGAETKSPATANTDSRTQSPETDSTKSPATGNSDSTKSPASEKA